MSRSNEAYFNGLKALELVDSAPSSRYAEDQIITAQWNAPATRIACSKTNGSVKIWRLHQCEPAKASPVTIDRSHEKPVESLDWKPTQETVLATVGNDRYVIEWNTARGQVLHKIDSGEERLFIVQYSGDAKYIAAVSKKNAVVLIDVETQTVVSRLQLNIDVYSITWNHGSEFLFIGLANGSIAVYNLVNDELKLVHTLTGHRSSIISLFFDRRGNYLLAGSKEGVVSVWSLDNFKCCKTIGDIDQPIWSVSLSRDSSYICATFEDGAPARIYEIATLKLVHEIPRCVSGSKTFPVFDFCPLKTTFLYATPDGKLFVTSQESGGPPPRR